MQGGVVSQVVFNLVAMVVDVAYSEMLLFLCSFSPFCF